MFKRVDAPEQSGKVEGFSYISSMGVEEKVVLGESGTAGKSVEIRLDDGFENGNYESNWVLVEDIPKLILALQAAYDHKE